MDNISFEHFDVVRENVLFKGGTYFICEVKQKTRLRFPCIAKCTIDSDSYKSFNTQQLSYKLCEKIKDVEIKVPKVVEYYHDDSYGDILILEKIDNIISIESALRTHVCYVEKMISILAKAISMMYLLGISGFDTEFYWQPFERKIVILDIGPMYSFDLFTEEMLLKVWNSEKYNRMGRWNIISEVMERQMAKHVFESDAIMDVTFEQVLEFI